MLIRTVRMTFHPEARERFETHFAEVAPRIRSFPGCEHLELWQDTRYPNVYTTYSHWESDAALQAYRESDLFSNAWATVKPLFAARPEAHSHDVAHSATDILTVMRERKGGDAG